MGSVLGPHLPRGISPGAIDPVLYYRLHAQEHLGPQRQGPDRRHAQHHGDIFAGAKPPVFWELFHVPRRGALLPFASLHPHLHARIFHLLRADNFRRGVLPTAKIGVQYLEWTKHTPAIIPKLQGFRRPNLPFSFRNVLKREYNGFFAVVLTFTLFEVLGELRLHGSWDLGTVRFAFLGAAFLIWATLRTLKKKTSFLHVTDR